MQVPTEQICPEPQAAHAAPPRPQRSSEVPGWQIPELSQQPVQFAHGVEVPAQLAMTALKEKDDKNTTSRARRLMP
ncbi:MAG: hypothetical protein JNJ54_32155 [Myxococcaceae bacterium]|nr:hypothetical protein [Myxococcaceae bacterium]